MNAFVNQYQSNQISTASPEQLLIMLFDGAIRNVREARKAIAEGNRAGKAKSISKAVAIVTEFSNTLDFEVGGDIALNLWSLYDFIVRELTAVNVRDDAQRLNPVEKVLLDLREGFAEAAIINRRAPQQVPAAETAEQRVVASF